MMQDDEMSGRIALVEAGRRLDRRGLAHGSAGNLSLRLGDGTILVTPTNSMLGALTPEAIAKVAADGTHLGGAPPSKEAFFHLAIYDVRPDAGAIVHLHATHAAAVSCLCHGDTENVLPPLTAYHVMRVGRLPLVPYFRPGDRALAEAVRSTARDHHAMLLANHGPVVAGRSLADAIQIAEELEETAKLFLLIGDRPASPLSCEAVTELEKAFQR